MTLPLPPFRAALALAVLVGASSAQRQFLDLGGEHLPRDQRSLQVTLADLDGDLFPDLLSNALGQPVRWLHNTPGTSRFAVANAPGLPSDAYQHLVLDVDLDGDLDVIVSDWLSTYMTLLVNDGLGHFTPRALPRISSAFWEFVAGDLNGDGLPDLVHGGLRPAILLNTGGGTFVPAPAGALVVWGDIAWTAIALADVDGDGDLDILSGSASNSLMITDWGLRLYLNDGVGRFTDVSARLPQETQRVGERRIANLDVDGDGDLDLVTATYHGLELFINDGSAGYRPASFVPFTGALCIANQILVVDFDRDGRQDLVVAADGSDRVFLNLGNALFLDATATYLGAVPGSSYSVTAADVDRDGDLDLCFGRPLFPNSGFRGSQDRLLLNQGPRLMADATRHPLLLTQGELSVHPPATPLLVDLNRDGKLDLVVGTPLNPVLPTRLFFGDGRGGFIDAGGNLPADTTIVDAIAAGDVDGDGDVDLVLGRPGFPGRALLLNDGTGRFTDHSSQLLGRVPSYRVALADLDGDGDLDMVCAGASLTLHQNNGAGVFTYTGSLNLPVPSTIYSFAAVDVDQDGDVDLLAVADQVYLFRNDGVAGFTDVTATQMPGTTVVEGEIAFGDFDGDGRVDIVVSSINGRLQAYRNLGQGTFQDQTAARMPNRSLYINAPRLVDVDGDGDLDLLTVVRNGPPVQFMNDGTGVFTDWSAQTMPGFNVGGPGIAIGDVDGDGDPDLVSAMGAVFFNLTRQLDLPFLGLTGTTMEFRLHAQSSVPQSSVGLVLLGRRLLASPVPVPPLGLLQLDPGLLLALPALLLPGPAGTASAALAVPTDPALVGAMLATQALIVPPRLVDARLTNALGFGILR